MKFWKNWPYWLRGGVVGGGMSIILFLGLDFLHLFNLVDSMTLEILAGPTVLFPAMILLPILLPFIYNLIEYVARVSHYNDFYQFIILEVISIIFWFIFGSLVGLLIGYFRTKIKRAHNKVSSVKN